MKRKSMFRETPILDRSSITENECYQTLTYIELFKLIRYFQDEKRRFFELYLKCVEAQIDAKKSDQGERQFEKERNKYWQKHLDCEKLVQWCFEETTRRTRCYAL